MPCVSKTKAPSPLCPSHRQHTFSVQPFQRPGHRALLEGPVWVVGMQQCVPEGIRALWLTGDLLPDRPSDTSVTRVISQALPSFLRWQGYKGFEMGSTEHRAITYGVLNASAWGRGDSCCRRSYCYHTSHWWSSGSPTFCYSAACRREQGWSLEGAKSLG